MGKMLNKKKRKSSFHAVESFLTRCSKSEFDIIVIPAEGHSPYVFSNIPVYFSTVSYPNNELSYSLKIGWNEKPVYECDYFDLPGEFLTYFTFMYCIGAGSKPVLSFHNTWHNSTNYHILEHVEEDRKDETLREYLNLLL